MIKMLLKLRHLLLLLPLFASIVNCGTDDSKERVDAEQRVDYLEDQKGNRIPKERHISWPIEAIGIVDDLEFPVDVSGRIKRRLLMENIEVDFVPFYDQTYMVWNEEDDQCVRKIIDNGLCEKTIQRGDPSIKNCGALRPPTALQSLVDQGVIPIDNLPAVVAVTRISGILRLDESIKSSSEAWIVGLRDLLNDHDIDHEDSLFVFRRSIDQSWEKILLITDLRKVLSFESNGVEFRDWKDLSTTWEATPHCRRVDSGLRLLDILTPKQSSEL